MKVEFVSRSETAIKECDWRSAFMVRIDGEDVFEVSDGEPEDSNLGRDFAAVYRIPSLMRKAYEAGKNGESYEEVESESDDI